MQPSSPQGRCRALQVGRPEMQQEQHLEQTEGNHPGTTAQGDFMVIFECRWVRVTSKLEANFVMKSRLK